MSQRGSKLSEETRRKMSEKRKEWWKNHPEQKTLQGRYNGPDTKERRQKHIQEWWDSHPEQKEVLSNKMKAVWASIHAAQQLTEETHNESTDE